MNTKYFCSHGSGLGTSDEPTSLVSPHTVMNMNDGLRAEKVDPSELLRMMDEEIAFGS